MAVTSIDTGCNATVQRFVQLLVVARSLRGDRGASFAWHRPLIFCPLNLSNSSAHFPLDSCRGSLAPARLGGACYVRPPRAPTRAPHLSPPVFACPASRWVAACCPLLL